LRLPVLLRPWRAKSATTTIPIVFETATDPVKLGLVASLNQPGGNLTGVSNLNIEMGAKRLQLLRELLPAASVVAVLIDPHYAAGLTKQFLDDLRAAAPDFGMQIHALHASTERELEAIFAGWNQLRADALVIGPYLFFVTHIEQLGAMALRYTVPAIFTYRNFVAAGGLLSYGPKETETYRLVGNYVGKVLRGAKPAELPVQRPTKIELVINLKTAKALGITIPLPLLGRADEVIE
jgi:putative tryptophan/tyrosine transport system substrate-binding protein